MKNENQKRTRGRPPSIDRNTALDAAVRVFWEKGYEAASLEDLTAAMKMSRPALYNAFGDKHALFLRALDAYGQTYGSEPLKAFLAADTIEEAVDAFLRTSLVNNTRSDCPTGCMFACAAAGAADTVDGAREKLSDALANAKAVLAQSFREATFAGELPANPSPEDRTTVLLDFMNAQALRARAGEDRTALLSDLPKRVALVLVQQANR